MDRNGESTRREFFRDMGVLAGGAALTSGLPLFAADAPDLVVVSGEDPKAMVKKAIEALGGMKRFVSKGDVVVIKPNIGWERTVEQAANTNPDVVVGLIEMAFDAGAKEIKVFDRSVQEPPQCYAMSGIAEAAKKAGAKVLFHTKLKTADIPIKDGVVLKKSAVWRDAVECDCYINVPVAKTHSQTRLTLAIKNHMGVTADDCGKAWHPKLDQVLADFASGFTPKLTVLDAYRIVIKDGPKAGNLADVQLARKCIAGVNQVSLDAYGATLFGKKPTDVAHIDLAGKRGAGEIDLAKLKIVELKA